MSRAIIVNPLRASSFTTLVGTASGTIAHLDNDYFGMRWRSGGNDLSIIIDLGADYPVNALGLLGITGADPAGMAVVNLATSAQGGSFNGGVGTGTNQYWQSASFPIHAGSQALPNGDQAGFWNGLVDANKATMPALARYVYVLCFADDPYYFQLARVVIGAAVQLDRQFSLGAAFGQREFGRVEYSSRAALLRRKGRKLRTCSIVFENAYRDEVEAKIQPLIAAVGNDSPILLITDPDANAMRTTRMFFGHLEGDVGTIWRRANGFQWAVNMVSLF